MRVCDKCTIYLLFYIMQKLGSMRTVVVLNCNTKAMGWSPFIELREALQTHGSDKRPPIPKLIGIAPRCCLAQRTHSHKKNGFAHGKDVDGQSNECKLGYIIQHLLEVEGIKSKLTIPLLHS